MSDVKLAEEGNWDEDFNEEQKSSQPANQEKTKIAFMDTSKAGVYKVRLVGPHVKFRKHFKPYKAVVQNGDKDIDPAWQAGWYPPEKWAINVIDRADGTLKVLEKGSTVFKCFKNYKTLLNVDPAGKDGPDFAITVTIPKDKKGNLNKLKTEYSVVHLEKAPFTKDDYKVMFETDDDGKIKRDENGKPISKLWKLREIYRSTKAEKMQEMWDALSDKEKIPPKRKTDEEETKKSSPEPEENESVEEKMDNAPSESISNDTTESNDTTDDADELFGSDDDNGDESGELF